MLTAVVVEVCTNAACTHALSHPICCECPCGGAGHGLAWVALLREKRERADMVGGFTSSMLTAINDEEF
jgi:hypothetical protein